MAEKKLLLIYNPKAGTGKIKTKISDIADLCVKSGYEVTLRPTQAKRDVVNYITKYGKKFEKIICGGGDGTLNEAVTALLSSDSDAVLGYIPTGSTNDFATNLGISSFTMKAAKTAVSGKPFTCDAGTFNDMFFVYVAAFGIMTDVSYGTSQKTKNVLGHLAYVGEALKGFTPAKLKPQVLSFVTDDKIIKDEFIYGMISNSVSVGGFKAWQPEEVELDDGKFEVLLVKYPRSPEELNLMISSFLAQDYAPDYMYCFKTNHLEIHSEQDISWTLDGENGGAHKDIVIDVKKQAFRICTSEETFRKGKRKKRI